MTEAPKPGQVYPEFPKGDVRRLLVLALAIAELDRPTLTSISVATGHHKQTMPMWQYTERLSRRAF